MPKMLQQVQRLLPWVLGSAGLMALALALVTPAPAADLNKPAPVRPAPQGYVKYWQGCGGGIHGAGVIGEAAAFKNVAPAANGELAGVHVVCDLQMGHGTGALVLGVEGNLDTVAGDLHSLGANWAWGGGARAGVLVTPSSLLYAHGGWRRLETDTIVTSPPLVKPVTSFSKLDGWVGGAGIELRLPTQMPFFVDTRYSYVSYGDPAGVSGADLHSHELRVGFTWKFGPTYVPSVD